MKRISWFYPLSNTGRHKFRLLWALEMDFYCSALAGETIFDLTDLFSWSGCIANLSSWVQTLNPNLQGADWLDWNEGMKKWIQMNPQRGHSQCWGRSCGDVCVFRALDRGTEANLAPPQRDLSPLLSDGFKWAWPVGRREETDHSQFTKVAFNRLMKPDAQYADRHLVRRRLTRAPLNCPQTATFFLDTRRVWSPDRDNSPSDIWRSKRLLLPGNCWLLTSVTPMFPSCYDIPF